MTPMRRKSDSLHPMRMTRDGRSRINGSFEKEKEKKFDGSRTNGKKKYYRNVVATRQKEPGNPEGSNNRETEVTGKTL